VIGSFFAATAHLLDFVIQALLLIVVVNALLSWVHPRPDNPVVHFLESVSNFLCNPIRKLFPTVFGGFDLAPMIVMLVLIFLKDFLSGMLLRAAM
jgi:YggT family protein